MNITITTASGTRYTIVDTAITRVGSVPIDGAADPVAATLMTWTKPTVGQSWRFTTVDGPIITTPVVAIDVDAFLAVAVAA